MSTTSSKSSAASFKSSLKTEFTEVLTVPELAPPSSNPSNNLAPVLTENTLLNTPANEKVTNMGIIEEYDRIFTTPELYHNFFENRFAPWKDSLELQHFDTLYTHHRATMANIKNLRQKAAAMLEEADKSQKFHHDLLAKLDRHLLTIKKPEIRRRLFLPHLVYPKPPAPRYRETFPPQSSNPSQSQASSSRIYYCFQCGSPDHIKWYCNHYRCRYCKKIAPGHSQKNCPFNPDNQPTRYDDGIRGHYDEEGYEDGNLNREC